MVLDEVCFLYVEKFGLDSVPYRDGMAGDDLRVVVGYACGQGSEDVSLCVEGSRVELVEQGGKGKRGEGRGCRDAVLEAVLELLCGDAIGITRWRLEGDWKVIEYRVEEFLGHYQR